MSRGILFVITAPSGAGKGTLRKALTAQDPRITFSPSVTTRSIRPGEVNGVDYLFVSREEFVRMRDRQDLSEWAEVYGNLYGTPGSRIEEILSSGTDVMLEKDVQGAKTLRKVYPEGIFIFILPPSMDELRRRIESRATEPAAVREVRLDAATREIADLSPFDYVIINADLDRAKARLAAIVAGERARSQGRLLPPEGQGRALNDQCFAGETGPVGCPGEQVQSGHRGGQTRQADS